jgi:hypothetical protein
LEISVENFSKIFTGNRVASCSGKRLNSALGGRYMSTKPQNPVQRDPKKNLFWWLIAFLGISIPKPGQEKRAIFLLILIGSAVAAVTAAAILTLFKLW